MSEGGSILFFRNSIKSIIRTPVKTVLYLILIVAVTAFLYLGINTWQVSVAMLNDSDANYKTIISLEYQEDYGSGEDYQSDRMLSEIQAIDFDRIKAHENVILWQPADVSIASLDGYVSGERDPEYVYAGVFIVNGLRQFAEDSPYYGKIVDTLYSFRPYEEGHGIFVQQSFGGVTMDADVDKTYVIHAYNHRLASNGLSVALAPFYAQSAEIAGIDTDAIPPYREIVSLEDFQADEDDIYHAIAQYYTVASRALNVHRVHALEDLVPFHQNYLELSRGRLYTPEEAEAGEKVAVISETLAEKRQLELGDALTIRLPDDEQSSAYVWGDHFSRRETYTVIGILTYHEDYYEDIYVPSDRDTARPVRFAHDLGQVTLQNGTVDAFLRDIEPLLPESVFISVYDQGYQATVDALLVIRNAAVALSLVALLVTLAVLLFFAYHYADTQNETVAIMRSFGTKKQEARRYLMTGAGVIAVLAVILGILIGTRYADRLIYSAYDFVQDLQVVDWRYSDGFRGIVKSFSPVVSLSYGLAFAVGCGIFLLALVFCLYYAERSVSGRLIQTRTKVRVKRAPKQSSVAFSGPLRHALLAVRRDKGRSFLVPLLVVASFFFVASLQTTLDSYASARDTLYEETELYGYTAKMNGLFSDALAIRNAHAKKLISIDGLENISYAYTLNYSYMGVAEYADGRAGPAPQEPEVSGIFELENLLSNLLIQPSIIFTDSVTDAPEFSHGEFVAEFAAGWDEQRLSSRDWDRLPAIVSTQFISEHGLSLGDTIRVYTQDYFIPMGAGLGLAPIDLTVVGRFTRQAYHNNIYAPLPKGALAPDASELNDLEHVSSALDTDNYFKAVMPHHASIMRSELTPQQELDVILDNKYVSSMSFCVPDATQLTSIKDTLEEVGFSGPAMPKSIRVAVVIEDSQFVETVSSIDQRSKFMEILYPVLVVLVAFLGLLTGFLAVKSRRENIALMRSMGTPKQRIFFTIWGEQILLMLLGVLPAMALWYVYAGALQLTRVSSYTFLIAYGVSTFLATYMQNRKTALAIMSEMD